jgi:maltose alpha-D-glucosyltransferase / alpha-amylase
LENCATIPFPENAAEQARDHVGIYLDSAATLGRRTAELHRALACPSKDPAFSPEPLTLEDLRALCTAWREQAKRAFDLLKESLSQLPDEAVESAGLVLGRRREILDRFRVPSEDGARGLRIRIHGNYHLGQVLREKSDFLIAGFEGELGRPLEERRAKQSPLKDVAGMLRSFSYSALTTLMNYASRRGEDFARLEPWARLWERSVAAEFVRAYRESAQETDFLPQEPQEFQRLLAGYWLDKAIYELAYELNYRPAWARIPLMGLLSLPRESGRYWN